MNKVNEITKIEEEIAQVEEEIAQVEHKYAQVKEKIPHDKINPLNIYKGILFALVVGASTYISRKDLQNADPQNSHSEVNTQSKIEFELLDIGMQRQFAQVIQSLLQSLSKSISVDINGKTYVIEKQLNDRIVVSWQDQQSDTNETVFVVVQPRIDNDGNNIDQGSVGIVNAYPVHHAIWNNIMSAMMKANKTINTTYEL